MKVWYYCHGGSYFWVAEGTSGYRTKGFEGGALGDPQAASAALAAAGEIDKAIAAKPEEQARGVVLRSLSRLRPNIVRLIRNEGPVILLLSHPEDDPQACVVAWDENTWVGDVAFGETMEEAANKAEVAFLEQLPDKVEDISFSEPSAFGAAKLFGP